ncbi:hypothetical protein [uncultured Parabacteroides sp.]|nr:hypothetical protein [uncultured Parabacteroides sp.]
MDKELPKDKLGLTPRKAHIRVTWRSIPIPGFASIPTIRSPLANGKPL